MSGAGEAGPRKLDSQDKRNYKELGNNQATSAKEKVQAVNEKAKVRSTNSTRPKASEAAEPEFGNWRAGNFGASEPKSKNSARGGGRNNGVADDQEPKIVCYGAENIIQEEEEKKVSKHAKRRANKKAKQAAGVPTEEVNSNGLTQQEYAANGNAQ